MELTTGQQNAMKMVESLLDSEEAAYGVITGYAGTGKTTLLKVIAELHDPPIILTPTGKAALRVGEATGLTASTIHKWLYQPMEDPKTGEVIWQRKPTDEIELPANGLLVVDEASMVSARIWQDLWSFASSVGLRMLLVGDKFQLPPVVGEKETPFSALVDLKTPYRTDLEQVVRQAMDSPIIRASMLIRVNEDKTMEAVRMLPSVPGPELVEAFLAMNPSRALIAHKNITRQELNINVRRALGFNEYILEEGEPLAVLYNNYQLDRFNGEVVNFGGWEYTPGKTEAIRDRRLNTAAMMRFGVAKIEGKPALLSPEEVFAQTEGLHEKTIARGAKRYAQEEWGYEGVLAPSHLNANLGYCLTCHKSQGSEWQDVMVVVEPCTQVYGYMGRRWLYTAITRARQNVSLCFI